jgi:aryl sulfotransferase
MGNLQRYRTVVADSARWDGIRFREGDIVIATPPKCGTTWMQMLVGMLVFDGSAFDRPLTDISPWVDLRQQEIESVLASVEAQQHRRFLKSHTPLDGLPFVEGVTYLTVGRDPRDVLLSMVNHLLNMNPAIVTSVLAEIGADPAELPPLDDPAAMFRYWIEAPFVPDDEAALPIGSLAELIHHLRTFWDRNDERGVALFHYDDLKADLPGQLERLARILGIDLVPGRIAELAAAATFERMRTRADELAPQVTSDFWNDNRRFFHRGTSGQWRDALEPGDAQRYEERLAELAPPELARWLHTGWLG